MPGPEKPAQTAHISATGLRHRAAHARVLSHFCGANSTVALSAKHLPLACLLRWKCSGRYMKGQRLVRCVHVPGRHGTDGSQSGDENNLRPLAYGTSKYFRDPPWHTSAGQPWLAQLGDLLCQSTMSIFQPTIAESTSFLSRTLREAEAQSVGNTPRPHSCHVDVPCGMGHTAHSSGQL